MDIKKVLEKADSLYAANEPAQACAYMEACLEQARGERDWMAELTLLNELMGHYRRISKFDRAWQYAYPAIELAEKYGVGETTNGVTTYLNVANVYRGCKKYPEAMKLYMKVEAVYKRENLQGDYRLVGLYNNMCVASMEAGNIDNAMAYGEKAIEIAKDIPGAEEECAIVYCNLAAMQMQKKNVGQAENYLNQSIELYETKCPASAHYAGAVAMKAYICYLNNDPAQSVALYLQAMAETKKHYGENGDFQRLLANCLAVCDKSGMTDKAQELRAQYQKGRAK